MNWAIVIPVGIGIAVLLSIALIAIDVSKMLYNREPFCTGCSEYGRCIQARMRYIHGLKHSEYPWICLKKEELK